MKEKEERAVLCEQTAPNYPVWQAVALLLIAAAVLLCSTLF